MPTMPNKLDQIIRTDVLQELQDAFAALTGMVATIVDTDDNPLTKSTDCMRLSSGQFSDELAIVNETLSGTPKPIRAPIMVNDHPVGAFVLPGEQVAKLCDNIDRHAKKLATLFSISSDQTDEFVQQIRNISLSNHTEAVRFVYLLADALSRMCQQDILLRQRADEMSTLYRISTMLSGQRDMKKVLRTVLHSAAQTMGAKSASIRLLDDNCRELVPTAIYNLSEKYLSKGPILLKKSMLDMQALDGEVVYVENMATDHRVLYPEDAKREGLVSILITPLIYWGKKMGVMRIYTDSHRKFNQYESNLLQAIGQLSAAAIENARLDDYRKESERIERQVQLAAAVQRRLMPQKMPQVSPFDVAARYEPCFELSGDFYDLIPFEKSIGLVVGDAVGKGVAASLLMASVRASLRAHAEDVYDLDEIMNRVNAALVRDTKDNEFVTAFYGTLDAESLRLTYCSAGHDPAYLLRDGQFTSLDIGGLPIGIDPEGKYDKSLIDLKPNDVLLIYSDGVPDAMSFDGESFGRPRIQQAMLDMANGSANDICNHILWEVRRFIGLNAVVDDMTLLVVKVGEHK